jgi:hypothetical protein
METYRHYFDIDPDYFPAVNEQVINNNPDMWKKYYPHETFVKLLKTTVSVLDRKQKLSIWVEGAYGTGKSHSVLTLKKLLDASDDDVDEYFERYNLDHDLLSNFKRVRNSGKILTVHRYGSSNVHGDNDLFLAIQESIEKSLAAAGIENKGSASLKEAAVRYLSDPENKASFNVFLKGSYANLFGGDDADAIIEKLRTYEDEALHTLMEKIFKVARERQILAFTMTADDLVNWIKEVIKENNLKAIVFIWDEFTEYLKNNSRNLTGFQKIIEMSQTEPFYFVLVTHVSESLFPEGDQEYIKMNGRFVAPHSQIALPENIAFQLMGAAMEKRKDPVIQAEWEETVEDLADRTKKSRKAVSEAGKIKDSEILGILPIHPYSALLLKHISSAFDSNQRSMFEFIKNDRGDEIKGFQWFIDNYGPEGGDESENPLLTVDMLWEFFYDKGNDNLTHDVRTVLDYYGRASNKGLDSEEKRVLKAVLLFQAISQHVADSVEMFIPNEKNIDLAFEGSDLDGKSSRIAEKLVRDKILFKKELGSGKFQYNAYINEVNGAELEKFKKEIRKKTTSSLITELLNDNTTVADAIAFDDKAMQLRYDIRNVSSSDFDNTIRRLRNMEDDGSYKIPAVVCYAKDDDESNLLRRKIAQAVESNDYHMVFIDATSTPLGQDLYSHYCDDMAQSNYQTGKDNGLAHQYSRNAKESLMKWKNNISNGEFEVYTRSKPEGERAASKEILESVLKEIDIEKYLDCLEAEYNVLPTMYTPSSLKLGVDCGVNRKTRQTYSSKNDNTKLETALADAWDDPVYWENHPNLLISKIKIAVDKEISDGFKSAGRVSIKSIYDLLAGYPYGFMPCNFSAFILGFVLKEYTDGTYTWSDGLTNDVLTLDKLKEMVDEVIKLQITPNSKYKDKYIVALTEEEKAFNEYTAIAFGVSKDMCTSIEQTRGVIRNKMKGLSFPIWTVKELTSEKSFSEPADVLNDLIDNYCWLANSGNLTDVKTDSDIANNIGRLYLDNDHAAEDLKSLLSQENCRLGMKKYLDRFDDGLLPELAGKIGDNGQYINAVRDKFDADAANWVWNIDTAKQKIREVILEYQIISASNEVLPKNISYSATINEWCGKCDNIRISYQAGKNYFSDMAPLMEMLYDIKRRGSLTDESQKEKFLEQIRVCGQAFYMFYNNQTDLFKEVCEYYLNGFSDEEIKTIYLKLPSSGVFTMDRSSYMNLVDKVTKEYRSSLGYTKLKEFWEKKTHSPSPREWSRIHRMPVLALVPDDEVSKARQAFGTLNSSHPDAASVSKAEEYLENATFYSALNDDTQLDNIFKKTIIKDYAVLLSDVDEVKDYLESRVSSDPYEWFGLPEIDKKLKQMAEAKYDQGGSEKALAKIDDMNVDDVKRYLKELIKDNMVVGMEIIKGN